MARSRTHKQTRQLYASIREDLYLAAKARATEMRVPLREFIEYALEAVLSSQPSTPNNDAPSIWDDEYLGMQARQPLGSPVELTSEEAERVVRAVFGSQAGSRADERTDFLGLSWRAEPDG